MSSMEKRAGQKTRGDGGTQTRDHGSGNAEAGSCPRPGGSFAEAVGKGYAGMDAAEK